MSKRILIDMIKCRECGQCLAECIYPHHPDNKGVNALLEAAVFQYTCRRCEDAPCISVCRAEALERKGSEVVERSAYLCVACKSCVAACPFGTLMNQFFDVRKSVCDYCRFDEDTEELLCMKTCPKGALSFTEASPDEGSFLYELNDKVMVKEYAWETIKETE
ncbi:MAG: 4Fe-4S dicluster domain-containing protein [Bacteroidales bacterium]|nr:4Fe-4S dicluster domain-containing protein [Bacteroidales bacterium]